MILSLSSLSLSLSYLSHFSLLYFPLYCLQSQTHSLQVMVKMPILKGIKSHLPAKSSKRTEAHLIITSSKQQSRNSNPERPTSL